MTRDKGPRPAHLFFLIWFLAVFLILPAAGAKVIKFAMVIPEEGPGGKEMRAIISEIKQKTGGEVEIRTYGGGIAGDEMDVIRKMRVGRMHMGAFSSIGLSHIVSSVRVLEMPGLYRDPGEIDYVREKMFDFFSSAFEKENFILLGFAEAGDLYLFSRKPLNDTSRLRDIKMWTWKGDGVSQTLFETLGMTVVPLHITDVNVALETDMVDAFMSPPLAAVAFQWHAKARYMLDFPMFNAMGAVLMESGAFNGLTPESQRIVRDTFRTRSFEIMRVVRGQNLKAMDIIRDAGIKIIRLEPDQKAIYQERLDRFVDKAVSQGVFTRELCDRVHQVIETYRAGKK